MKLVDAIIETDKLRNLQYPSGKVLKYAMRYVRSNKQLFMQAVVASGSQKGVTYQVRLVFNGILSSDKRTRVCTLKYKDIDGSSYYIQKPTSEHNIMTRCSCFTGDTLIHLANGSSISIKDLVDYDDIFVYTYDIEQQKTIITKAIAKQTGINQEVIELTFDNNKTIKCTPDHLFLLKNGEYKQAIDLQITDHLMSLSNIDHKIKKVEKLQKLEDVYCLEVDNEHHNFAINISDENDLASGVFVHNCSDFRFMWHWWLGNKKALLGPRIPYVRKTTHYPEKNPQHIPGIDKHLLTFIKKLTSIRLLKVDQRVKSYLNRPKRTIDRVAKMKKR